MTNIYQPDNSSVVIHAGVKIKPTIQRLSGEDAIRHLIALGRPFSADDVRELAPRTDPAQMGELFRLRSVQGHIKRIGDFRSTVKSRRGGRSGIWINTNSLVNS